MWGPSENEKTSNKQFSFSVLNIQGECRNSIIWTPKANAGFPVVITIALGEYRVCVHNYDSTGRIQWIVFIIITALGEYRICFHYYDSARRIQGFHSVLRQLQGNAGYPFIITIALGEYKVCFNHYDSTKGK